MDVKIALLNESLKAGRKCVNDEAQRGQPSTPCTRAAV